jgi:hypothetical protein
MNTLLAYDPVAWVMAQPTTRFSLDAKCIVAQLVLGDERFMLAPLFTEKLLDVRRSRLADGSFESKYGGGLGSVLWTADAIRWLHLARQPEDVPLIDTAAKWLAARQRADGSWLEEQAVPWRRGWYRAPAAHVWITSAILQSLWSSTQLVAAQVTKGFALLIKALGQFSALVAGRAPDAAYHLFGFDYFSLAVCTETFAVYREPMPAAAEAVGYFLQGQQQDGSWSDSIDVTQSSAHALLLLTRDPELAQIGAALSFLSQRQNKDGSWSHRPGEPGDWTLTAYTTRLFIRIAQALNLPLSTTMPYAEKGQLACWDSPCG